MTQFIDSHNGPRSREIDGMLKTIGVNSLETLIDKTVPTKIRLTEPLNLPQALSEYQYLNRLRHIGSKNKLFRSFIGQGYYGTAPLSVIIRNVLENPAWYTSYTPYQAEISQGRLEALLNFQTMITDLTGMAISNASLLDEATAAAEAMVMSFNARSRASVKAGASNYFVDRDIFPQVRDLLVTRSAPLGIKIIEGDCSSFEANESFFGAFVQYPTASGKIMDYSGFVDKLHSVGALVTFGADILSLALLTPPGEWGADIVVGSVQRLGLPMSFGGPHAGYFATREELKRNMPGRLIGVSVDTQGNKALRLSLQTREQHIKRERATSNICTAQALLATMSGMYAQYHGSDGLREIALRVHKSAREVDVALKKLGYIQNNDNYFDTLDITVPTSTTAEKVKEIAEKREINFYYPSEDRVMLSCDEIITEKEIGTIISIFAEAVGKEKITVFTDKGIAVDKKFLRESAFLTSSSFNKYHSETGLMRYIKRLEHKDFSLADGMIPLGSCTMKLNSATSMFAMSWPEFANIHPFVPGDQAQGYHQLIDELGEALKEITGFSAVSFQPNSGAAGEYAGMLTIRQYHICRGEANRNTVLIPASAHGTNPASAAMAGMNVVVVGCDGKGNVDLNDLKMKVDANSATLAALMITYPSTHGVFESSVMEITDLIHANGGLVYMDGANMNGQVGLTSPGVIGADICHLNLHKTFASPHGGGGPGEGPILCNEKLAEFLPSHPVVKTGGSHAIPAVAAAPYGSAHILTISHAYIMMMGAEGLTKATKYAILNANYLSYALKNHYQTLYVGTEGFVAHELIIDFRDFKDMAGITEADVAKRLMDYGFHAPTLSFPVHGTLMVEPTESEPLEELDRFVDAMISIHEEIEEIARGEADKENNVLHNAPHTIQVLTNDTWDRPYSRSKAAFPREWIATNKFWPAVSRVDDGYGDRNLVVTNAPLDEN
jgi:glycine dehydrogenase